MPNVNQILIIAVVIVIVVVVALLATGQISLPPVETAEEQTEAQEVLSVAGQVKSVDVDANSFVVTDQDAGQDITVRIGDETEFISLIFPFDPASPPEEIETFVPERETATIQGLEVGDFVFVRSSHVIEIGGEVIDPLEIQILP